MAQSNTADLGPWRSVLVQGGLLVVGIFSVLILFSFGGQVIVAPALLPAQWIIARHTSGWVSTSFAMVGALLLVEVVWLLLALVIGDAASIAMGLVAVVVAIGAGIVFFNTSRRRGAA